MDEVSRNDVLVRSREVRQKSARICVHQAELRERVGAERRRSLLVTTAATDAEVSGHPVMLARLDRLSATLGRSPEIEQAKAMIAAKYGVTRGQAFDILRRISSRTNRKLRDVAADVAQGRPLAGGPSGPAPLSHG